MCIFTYEKVFFCSIRDQTQAFALARKLLTLLNCLPCLLNMCIFRQIDLKHKFMEGNEK